MQTSNNEIPDINNTRGLARALTVVENDLPGAADLLKSLRFEKQVPIIGITGPPGAGKSTLLNAIIYKLTEEDKKVAVLAVDPTSPFNFGSLLGDRIRMTSHFNNPNVFIRSLATRGSLGGLSAKTIEMSDVLRAAGFDYIFVETVGVGQSEIEVAGLADMTLVVLVPESGDEIQNIKSGLMEIADAFIINKADRDGADFFVNNLKKLAGEKHENISVIKTIASQAVGVNDVINLIKGSNGQKTEQKTLLLTEKAYNLIRQKRMTDVDRRQLQQQIAELTAKNGFNLYSFVDNY